MFLIMISSLNGSVLVQRNSLSTKEVAGFSIDKTVSILREINSPMNALI